MRILKATRENVLTASQAVKTGGLVVYPTDTVYGLGCDPFNVDAVKRVFRVKGKRKKPLPILASDIEHVEKIVYLSKNARKITDRFWPGPLMIVVPKKPTLPNIVTCNLGSVGVRVPKHDLAIQFISLSNGLLVGTSANKTGKKPALTASEAAEQLGKEVDVILDIGPTSLGVPSTVINLTSEKPKILRKGPVSSKDIFSFLQ